MRGIMRVAGVLATSALVAGGAKAQTCLGRPFFSTGPIQVGAGANMSSSARGVGADVTLGQDRSVFGRMGIAHASQDADRTGPTRAGTEMNATVGYQKNMTGPMHAQFCPYASYGQRGLDANGVTPDRTFSQSDMNLGASVGWVIPHRGTVHVVPFAGLAYAHSSGTVALGGTTQQRLHDDYLPGTVGVGVHVADRWMVTGQATVPFYSNRDPMFRASVILPTGRNR